MLSQPCALSPIALLAPLAAISITIRHHSAAGNQSDHLTADNLSSVIIAGSPLPAM